MTADEDSDAQQAATYYRALLRGRFRNRRWLVFGGPLAAQMPFAKELEHLGAERLFLLGSTSGAGELPAPEFACSASFDLQVADIREEFSRYESLLRAVPDATARAIDAWDPERRARAIGLLAMSVIPAVSGRRTYAPRRPEWLALEDKTRIDEFWRSAGVACVSSEVVPLEPARVRAAIERQGSPAGAVLAGDARNGIHGGAQGVMPVWNESQLENAIEALAQHHSSVRVMPYLEGQPCSIHGVVFPEGVSVFRPVEMVTLIDRAAGRFRYAGLGTFWDPPEHDREFMRSLARRVGKALDHRLAYRGPFAIDGVLGPAGFRPTELNSRFGAGLGPLAAAVPTLPLSSLCLAAAEGETLDYKPDWLEAVVVAEADRKRSGRGSALLTQPCQTDQGYSLVESADGYRTAEENEPPDATVRVGPAAVGSFVGFWPEPTRLRPGPALAPRVAHAFEWADRELGTQIGSASPAGSAAKSTR